MTEDRVPAAAPAALADLIRPRAVRAKLSASTWEDAVDLAGGALVASGSVERGYVPAMKRVLKKLGAYAVLAPGAVLLHARPEDGVREACLGLVTLRRPVDFGHRDNDPVDLVFSLGAVDHEGHVEALRELAGLLQDEAALARIRLAADDATLLEAVRLRGRPPQ
jgi:mannitol/fructose-specific phosphotransferase system IIA component (Ntr-type)